MSECSHTTGTSRYGTWILRQFRLLFDSFRFADLLSVSSDVHPWSALLCITDNDLPHTDPLDPPVKSVEIEFRSIDDSAVHGCPNEYHVQYQGLQLDPGDTHVLRRMNPDDGVAVEQRWLRGPFHSINSFRSDGMRPASYATRIHIPIPLSLFAGRECRYFTLKAKVLFENWEVPYTVAHSGTVKVSIEHLRKEIHMDGRRSLDV